MADIPGWVLVLNTLAAGGFGLAGTYLVPRGQREARSHDERQANARIMRDKAEDIFSEISKLEQIMGLRFVAATRATVAGDDSGDGPLPSFDKIRALAAVYYPSLLAILDEIEAPIKERMARALAAFKTATASKPLAAQEADLRLLAFEATLAQWKNVNIASRELRAKLIEEVCPYLPTQRM